MSGARDDATERDLDAQLAGLREIPLANGFADRLRSALRDESSYASQSVDAPQPPPTDPAHALDARLRALRDVPLEPDFPRRLGVELRKAAHAEAQRRWLRVAVVVLAASLPVAAYASRERIARLFGSERAMPPATAPAPLERAPDPSSHRAPHVVRSVPTTPVLPAIRENPVGEVPRAPIAPLPRPALVEAPRTPALMPPPEVDPPAPPAPLAPMPPTAPEATVPPPPPHRVPIERLRPSLAAPADRGHLPPPGPEGAMPRRTGHHGSVPPEGGARDPRMPLGPPPRSREDGVRPPIERLPPPIDGRPPPPPPPPRDGLPPRLP